MNLKYIIGSIKTVIVLYLILLNTIFTVSTVCICFILYRQALVSLLLQYKHIYKQTYNSCTAVFIMLYEKFLYAAACLLDVFSIT